MPEFILNAGVEIPLILILLALLGFRREVNPRARLLVKAPQEKVFSLVDLHHGKVQAWSRTTITSELLDEARQVFRMTYVTTLSTGTQQKSQASFRVVERRVPSYPNFTARGWRENPSTTSCSKLSRKPNPAPMALGSP